MGSGWPSSAPLLTSPTVQLCSESDVAIGRSTRDCRRPAWEGFPRPVIIASSIIREALLIGQGVIHVT